LPPTEPIPFDVFVYGTLKRGQRNHDRFCKGVLSVQEATVHGRLYDLPLGFPALVVPQVDVTATGTEDYLADAERQRRATPGTKTSATGWSPVYGDLLSFDDPEKRLPALDGLEGFRPGKQRFYTRVLVPATLTDTGTTIAAWTYVVESESGVYLPGGRWPS